MGIFMMISHLLLTVVAGVGVFSFSGSYLMEVAAAVAVCESARRSPAAALLLYPLIEYLFNGGSLTAYSAITIAISLVQIAVVLYASANRTSKTREVAYLF